MGDLIVKMGIDDFGEYMVRLANFIIENDAHVQNHYDTILKWWREDTSIESKNQIWPAARNQTDGKQGVKKQIADNVKGLSQNFPTLVLWQIHEREGWG